MRIAVLEIRAGGEQRAGLAQVGADRPLRRIELGVDHAPLAAEPLPVRPVEAAVVDREHRIDPRRLADQEILLAMVGRHVDEPGTGVGGDMLGREEGTWAGEEAAEMVHRVAGDGSGEVGALALPDRLQAHSLKSCPASELVEKRSGHQNYAIPHRLQVL